MAARARRGAARPARRARSSGEEPALPRGRRVTRVRVRLLASDVDGVLTDGTLYIGPAGEALKSFHVRDGLGVRQLLENGVEVALITGRQDAAVLRRAEEL